MEEQRRLAADPSTTPETLQALAKLADKEVQEAVVKNPNTPLEVLLLLGPKYAAAFIENASLPLHLLAAPELFQGLPEPLVQEILHAPTPPAWIWELALKRKMYRALASAPQTSTALLQEVYKQETDQHENKYTFRFLAEHKNTPVEILSALAESTQEYVRMGVAENRAAPLDLLRKLLQDKLVEVRNAVLANPSVEPELFEKLPKDKLARMLRHLAENESPKIREWAKQQEDQKAPKIARAKREKPTATPIISEAVAPPQQVTSEPRVLSLEEKRALAMAPTTSYEELLPLVAEDDEQIQRALLKHPNAYSPLLESLLQALKPTLRVLVTESPNCSESVLDRLAEDPQQEVRIALVEGVHVQIKQLEMLSTDLVDEVRILVAGHEKTPSTILKKMVRDLCTEVRRTIADNPKTPRSTLQILAKDTDEEVQELAADRL